MKSAASPLLELKLPTQEVSTAPSSTDSAVKEPLVKSAATAAGKPSAEAAGKSSLVSSCVIGVQLPAGRSTQIPAVEKWTSDEESDNKDGP